MPAPTKSAFLASLTAAIPGECPICYQPMELPYKTPCNHTFCRECATAWFEQSASCPTCRTTLYTDGEGGDTNVLPGDLTLLDITNVVNFLATRIKNLKEQAATYEKLVKALEEEVEEWKERAERLQEVYEENMKGLERLEGVLREKIGMLKEEEGGREEEPGDELVRGVVKMGLESVQGKEGRSEAGED